MNRTATHASSGPAIPAVRGEPLLSVRNLRKWFPIQRGVFGTTVGHVKAVDDVSFDLAPGECLGLVGESGSGKTTIGRCLLRGYEPTGGSAVFQTAAGPIDLAKASSRQIRRARPDIQMVFQDPFASLNPRMTVLDIVGEPLLVNGMRSAKEREQKVRELLEKVELNPESLHRYPHAFSGGQRQRVNIARALALNPRLIIADEPVAALDVSVQAQVLNLLMRLQKEFNLALIFIAHDLGVVRHLCDRVAVLYVGKLVEIGETDELFENARHPYTRSLLAAVPSTDPTDRERPAPLAGEVADPAAPPSGCAFHPRCPLTEAMAQRAEAVQVTEVGSAGVTRPVMRRCVTEEPQLREIKPGAASKCHYLEQLTLEGQQLGEESEPTRRLPQDPGASARPSD